MKVRAFITHKLSERYSDCQDRFCINEAGCRIAVSDGMSQSVFPDYWAEILSQHYAEEGHCTDEDRKGLCKKWIERVVRFIGEEINNGKNPWRLQNCIEAQNGAGATICGVQFKNAKEWQGQVLGDSCVIEVDNLYGIKNIHTSETKVFDSYPDYYESFPTKVGRGSIINIQGEISETKYLLLVSDPFSEFLYNNRKKCDNWLSRIIRLKSHEEYCSLVDDWREEGLHNDDSTLCIVEYDGSDKFNIEFCDNINDLIAKENGILEQSESVENVESKENIALEDSKGVEVEQTETNLPESVDGNALTENVGEKNEDFSNIEGNCDDNMDGRKERDEFIKWVKENCNDHKNIAKQKDESCKCKNPNVWMNEFDSFCQEVIDKVRVIFK